MYKTIEKYFSRKSAGRLVVESFLRYGISVQPDGNAYCGTIELAPAKVGRALGVDRRVVISVSKQIASHEDLLAIFGRLQPRAYVGESAHKLGFDSIEISADSHATGIVAAVAGILAKNKIAMRQIIADDPDLFPDAKLNIVTDGKLTAKALSEIRALGLAEKIAIK